HVDPITVVQMENRGGGHGCEAFFLLTVEGGVHEHAHAHQGSGIGYFHADFGRADVGIENRADVVDSSRQHFIRVSDQPNLGGFPHVNIGKIVFVDVAKNPDVGKIGDSERIGASETLNA